MNCKKVLLVATLLICKLATYAQILETDTTVLTTGPHSIMLSAKTPNGVLMGTALYKKGSDIAWANKIIDETDWQIINLDTANKLSEGWLRLALNMDNGLNNKDMVITLPINGVDIVMLDGQKIEPYSDKFNYLLNISEGNHILALHVGLPVFLGESKAIKFYTNALAFEKMDAKLQSAYNTKIAFGLGVLGILLIMGFLFIRRGGVATVMAVILSAAYFTNIIGILQAIKLPINIIVNALSLATLLAITMALFWNNKIFKSFKWHTFIAILLIVLSGGAVIFGLFSGNALYLDYILHYGYAPLLLAAVYVFVISIFGMAKKQSKAALGFVTAISTVALMLALCYVLDVEKTDNKLIINYNWPVLAQYLYWGLWLSVPFFLMFTGLKKSSEKILDLDVAEEDAETEIEALKAEMTEQSHKIADMESNIETLNIEIFELNNQKNNLKTGINANKYSLLPPSLQNDYVVAEYPIKLQENISIVAIKLNVALHGTTTEADNAAWYIRCVEIATKHGLLPLQAWGSTILLVQGLNAQSQNNTQKAINAAQAIQLELTLALQDKYPNSTHNIAISTGDIYAGIAENPYRLVAWGDAINKALSLVLTAQSNKIIISEQAYGYVQNEYLFTMAALTKHSGYSVEGKI